MKSKKRIIFKNNTEKEIKIANEIIIGIIIMIVIRINILIFRIFQAVIVMWHMEETFMEAIQEVLIVESEG